MKRYLKLVILYIVIVFLLSTITYASTETSISNAVTRDEIEENSLEESVSGEIETFSDFTYGNYQYTENSDGTVKITKYTGNEQNVSIPSSINGKKVTIIGAAAFYSKTSIQTVIVPNTVTDLETGAFIYCRNLTRITLGSSVKTIGDCVFESCSFTEIKIPASVTSIDVRAFYDCPALSKIEVDSANATFCSIDGILFSKDKTKLCSYPKAKTNTTYTIPNTVKELGSYSFESNKNLKNVTIPNSVTTLGYGVFYKAEALTSIVLPSSITKMEFSCFEMATSLKNVVINTQTSSIPHSCFKGCTNLVSVDATNSTANLVNDDAFKECTKLTQVKLPSKLECIREGAFANCNSLTTLTIPDSILLIEKDFDLDSEKLTNIDMPDGIEKAESGNYIKNVKLTISGTNRYDFVNQVVNLVNKERKSNGLGNVTIDKELTEAAMERALEISLYLEHSRPGTGDCFTISSKAMAENIAGGQSSPESVMDSWMNSTTHKSNILGKNYKSIGIGCFEKDGTLYWVQLFGNSNASGTVATNSQKVTKTKLLYYYYAENLSSNISSNKRYKVGETINVVPYLINAAWSGARISLLPTEVSFSSSDTSVMTVDKNGNMKGLKAGTANLIIKLGPGIETIKVNFENEINSNEDTNNKTYTPEQIANLVFDYKYYADKYPDLKAAFGYNEAKLKLHWLNSGINEGRTASSVFDVKYYLANNSDLQKAFGTNYKSAYEHFISNGYKELRKSSSLYWGEYYKNNNSDLKNMDAYELMLHYINFGKNEGRKANEVSEVVNIVKPEDIRNSLFNAKLYYDLYPDLRVAFGYNETALKNHWLNSGINEGRIASLVFDAKYYLENNSDLKKAFGNNYKSAYEHFVNNGINEGRKASLYFDVKYYLNNNNDLNKAYGNTYSVALNHFVNIGMKEGRNASSDFKVSIYKSNYEDLRKAFGNDILSYYEHYILYGKNEGRKAK